MLGIKFSHGDYPKKLGCKAQKIDQWKGLSLNLRVRVNLIKIYLFPLFIYLGSVCILPEPY